MVAEHLGVWTVGEIQLVIYDGTSRGNWMAVSTTLGGQAQPVSGKPVTAIRLADAAVAQHHGVVGTAQLLSSCTWAAFGVGSYPWPTWRLAQHRVRKCHR
jgi:hypothetical protein